MALSTAVFVGESRKLLPEIVAKAKELRVGSGFDPKADVGPMISPVHPHPFSAFDCMC